MLIVSGDVTARTDRREDMLRAAVEHVHRSRLEPGCISHDVSVDAENPLRLMFFERWQDEAALKAHFAVPASRAFWKLLQSLAAEPGAMHIYEAREIRHDTREIRV
ncbi:MAG: putative quinol monooxygenase [Alphaproteobacteria bacterium]